ncbi:diatom-specific cyclin [Seminavis robusta]|uniref:Diatom-specific cyclin n=1 Tax=Seminavis robusta TaxID=568900 RepID=A0A9N8DV55_9STRA|nr:diatom-specific cyclin [Seminavis robusta]|eukprot:Sro299_g111520.1 diatom-specific cyclin (306) ;mRNA; f:70727-71644
MDMMTTTLEAMFSQEKAYHCQDYILQDNHNDPQWLVWRTGLLSHDDLAMNRAFRTTMVGWSQQVIDFIGMRRETVEYALSFFDRYLQCPEASTALRDRVTFQLAFVTCTYMAIKLHEPTAMSPKIFAKLSQGNYCFQQIERMEFNILKALGWRVNPPTGTAFVRQILSLFPDKLLPPTMKNTVCDLAKVQIDLVLGDYRFVPIKRSTLAMACLFNAFESLQYDEHFLEMTLAQQQSLQASVLYKESMDQVPFVRHSLYQVMAALPQNAGFVHGGIRSPGLYEMASKRASCEQHSPRSVYNSNFIR